MGLLINNETIFESVSIAGKTKTEDMLLDMKECLRGFFKRWYFGWLLVGLTPVLFSVYIYFNSIDDLDIYPNLPVMDYRFYTDTANNGNSVITKAFVSDSLLQFNFDLNTAFVTPYVGVEMHRKDRNTIILWPFNQVEIEVEGEVLEHLLVSLYSKTTANEDVGDAELLCFSQNIKLVPGKNKYVFSIDQFRIPEWYSDAFQIPDFKTVRPHYREITYLNINNAYHQNLLKHSTIKLYTLRFTRDNSRLVCLLLFLFFGVMLMQVLVYYWRLRMKYVAVKRETVFYKPINIEGSNVNDVPDYLKYINSNFINPSLSLELVSKAIGQGQRLIASGIQEAYSCNFKTYVNQIRITEAKRLLKQTDLNINEVAYNVGFNSQSHFARVFKSLCDQSPSAFRAKS